jgi:cytidylate kinase
MTAAVVTFTNQIGANGGSIARAVAEKLRYRYYDWEVISQAALEAGVSPETMALALAERAPGFLERMMQRLSGPSVADEAAQIPDGPRPSMLTSDDYRHFIGHVVRSLAQKGEAVIVNHAGQAILRDQPGVLKVLLFGSLDCRVKHLAEVEGSSEEDARRVIQESDRQRHDFFRRAYHMEWLEASHYDVVLNTDRLSLELARDMIVACAREVP